MSRRPLKGLLDELQTNQEKELQNFLGGQISVQLDDDDDDDDEGSSNDSEAEKHQNKALKQLQKFLLKNQINVDNAFQMDLPEEIHLAISPNFTKSSMYLQALATLYGIRVDSTLRDSFKVKCGLLRIHGVNTFEDQEVVVEEVDKEKAVQKTKQISKQKIGHYGLSTLDKGFLDIKQYETVQMNPFFHQVSKRLDLQSLSSMLTYRPLYSDDMEMIIDPEQLNESEQVVPQHQHVKIEFQFEPPQPTNYDQYLAMDIMHEMQEEEGVMFNGFTKLRQNINDDSKKHKIRITKQYSSDVKSSDHEKQSQLDWNQFLDHTQYEQQDYMMKEEEEIIHIQNPSQSSQGVTTNGINGHQIEEEQQPLQVIQQEEEAWSFVNCNFDENVAPLQPKETIDIDQFKFNQIEDQSSSQKKQSSSQKVNNIDDNLKIRDLLDPNAIPFPFPQTFQATLPQFPQRQQQQFDFSDYLHYDRSIFQHKKQQVRTYPKEIQIKCTEKPQIEFSLARFFDFSLRQVFFQEPTEHQNGQVNHELDELIYQENVYFEEDNEQPQQEDNEQPQQEEYPEALENEMIQEPSPHSLRSQEEHPISSHEQQPKFLEEQHQVTSQLIIHTTHTEETKQQETLVVVEQQVVIQMQEEVTEYKQQKRPYKINFKVVLPEDKQNQIPVKLLKQCVYKIIQPILDEGKSVSFSRIWLTLKYILPSCHKLITVGQLYIAVLFLSNEEQLLLGREIPGETEFQITKKP